MAGKRFRDTWRVWVVVAAIVAGAVVVTGRLVQLQIIHHDEYAQQARDIHYGAETLTDRRGALLDRNGYPLAASEATFNVMVERRAWEDPEQARADAAKLAQITGVSVVDMLATVSETEVFEIAVARDLDYGQALDVRGLGLTGVRLLEDSQRVYPEGNLAAQLIGFVGQDNRGLTGLELDLDPVLGGNPGTVTYEHDGLGRELALGNRDEVPPQPGANVVLTIDRYIQRLAEQELDKAVAEHKAEGGTIIVVQPETGAILAMASRPTFDVTQPLVDDNAKQALYRNRAITDPYEPGSVFKLITASAAIDQGLVTPGTWWNDTGVFEAGGWQIRNWDFSANGSQTVQQILTKSLNTGAAWLASLCGPGIFYDYVHRFGFGSPTESILSGEAGGHVRTPVNDPQAWSSVDLATNSFGQGISVTPLQMAMAVAAIANDGRLMKPQVVREIIGPLGHEVIEPEAVQQVISAESARTMLDMMGVVVDGYYLVDVPGYNVGGKSGTANIASGEGGYRPDAYISSFAGVVPLDDPRLAVLVKINEPKDVPWGTVVAAPAFNRLAQQALAYLNIAPSEEALVASVEN